MAAILDWPAGSDQLVARLARPQVTTAVLDQGGKVQGSVSAFDLPTDARFYPIAALSPLGDGYVLAAEESELGGTETFYFADAKTGAVRKLFTSSDLPGVVEEMWLSRFGLLIVASERGKFHELVFDTKSNKMTDVTGKGADVKSWPGAPPKMMFATYEGGYQLDLATGKTKRIVEFESGRMTSAWRTEVQGGRLYPRKDGDYTSVSHAANAVDIRVIDKDGDSEKPILRRR